MLGAFLVGAINIYACHGGAKFYIVITRSRTLIRIICYNISGIKRLEVCNERE